MTAWLAPMAKEIVRVDGLRELEAALLELPRATAKNVMRRVLLKRGKPIADAAASRARVDKNKLKPSFKVGTQLSRRQKAEAETKSSVQVYIGPDPLVQAITEEFGTESVPANPMLRPAWEAGKDAVLVGIGQDMWAEIKKAAERKARKEARASKAGG